jgi:hypothetical protein
MEIGKHEVEAAPPEQQTEYGENAIAVAAHDEEIIEAQR